MKHFDTSDFLVFVFIALLVYSFIKNLVDKFTQYISLEKIKERLLYGKD